MPITGHAGTITLSGAGFKWRSIDFGEATVPVLDISDLSTTTWAQKKPGDLNEPMTVDIEFVYDPEDTELMFDELGVVQTGTAGITITYPKQTSGSTNAAKVHGSGFVISSSPASLATNEVCVAQLTFQFDGISAPTVTQEA